MSRLGELDERAGFGIVAVEPEVGAEDLPIPVGAFGFNHDGGAVGGKRNVGVAHGIEEFVEGEFGLGLGGG